MTTRGIYITPDNIVANRNRKKSMNIYDNYPPGAANDPNAPYNQEPDVEYTRTVSVSVSFDFTTEGPEGADKEVVKEWIEDEVTELLNKSDLNKVSDNFNIDDLEIVE